MKNFKFIHFVIATSAILFTTFLSYQFTIINATEIKHESTTAYKPRPGRKRTQARKPGGYRGDSCNLKSQAPVTLLVPEDHIPLTTLDHPLFFWYVNTISNPIRFTIYQPGQLSPIYVQNITPKTPGIMALRLPESTNALKIGVQYRWTVSVICNPEKPSENIYAKAWIERVEDSFGIDNKSNCQSNYAKSGIWYDALSCQAKSTEEFWSLLNQVELSTISHNRPQITFF